MTTQPARESPSSSPWLAETLRLTGFPLPGTTVDPHTWWETVTGQQPEVRNAQPRLGVTQEEGQLEGGRLALVVQPSRFDWIFTTAFDAALGLPVPERFLPFPAAQEMFARTLNRWFGLCPSLTRLAFGAVLSIPVADKPAGYQQLAHYLPDIHLDPEGSSDFSYQINRPRNSGVVRELKINRLSRWSVALSMLEQIVLGPGGLQYPVSGPENRALRLELDINTSTESARELAPDDIAPLFQELIQLGQEISEQGDIK